MHRLRLMAKAEITARDSINRMNEGISLCNKQFLHAPYRVSRVMAADVLEKRWGITSKIVVGTPFKVALSAKNGGTFKPSLKIVEGLLTIFVQSKVD
jgi:hypothetical protein